jgi:phosphoribosylformylglycinamidine synthase
MAIAAGSGAAIHLGDASARLPTAALFGERAGRVIVSVRAQDAAALADAAADDGVPAVALGRAGGETLQVGWGDADGLSASVASLRSAWETPF